MQPYKRTAIFDQDSLPAALRREHRTKAGVWGLIRVLEGRLRIEYRDGSGEQILLPGAPGLVNPEQPHLVEPLGDMRMQVEFYAAMPPLRLRISRRRGRRAVTRPRRPLILVAARQAASVRLAPA